MRIRGETAGAAAAVPRWIGAQLLLILLLAADRVGAQAPSLARFLGEVPAGVLVSGADSYGPVEGDPPAAAVLRGGEIQGYAFLTTDYVNATGYSGKPIHILLAMDREGVVLGARLVAHSEPIVLVGIPESRIRGVIEGYVGRNVVRETVERVHAEDIDIIAGATVTIMVIDDSIRRAAVKLARSRGWATLGSREEVNRRALRAEAEPEVRDWRSLMGDGSVRRLTLSVGDVDRAFAETGQTEAARRPESDDPDAVFIDLYAGLASVPTVGRSLLGAREYALLRNRLAADQHAILVMGNGLYSFKGSGYVRGGVFDRIQLVQDDISVRFRDRDHKRLADVAADGAPGFAEVALFTIPADAGFNPADPWRLELLVNRQTGAREKAFIGFALDYRLPERYLAGADAAADLDEAGARKALWQRIWLDQLPAIVILAGLLGVLTLIFFFQDWLVKRRRLMTWIRYSYLVIVLVWLGFVMNAQLSVVNVLTFANALVSDFSWGYFLMAPLIFILWVGVAAGMIFWGRGVFCGWLCPYGALQELTNRLGRRLGIPQIELPWGLNERLWPVKYIIFLGLFGTSFYSMALAEQLAEVEPFKTAIIMNFARAWPFVLFAGGLIVVNLFIERFFCRYLCPLGAALAIPGRIRMFDWLKRYRECGNPCQICYQDCPTAAIHPDGRINVNECIYCLDCQKLYYDDRRCPHMIQQRQRRERRLIKASDSALTPKQRAEKAALLSRKSKEPEAVLDAKPSSKGEQDVGNEKA